MKMGPEYPGVDPFFEDPVFERNSAKSFTMVELLVVIAIITILMAMLSPALRNARDIAKSAQCISSLRQMYLGMVSYAQEHEDGIPEISDPLTGQPWGYSYKKAGLAFMVDVRMRCPARTDVIYDPTPGSPYNNLVTIFPNVGNVKLSGFRDPATRAAFMDAPDRAPGLPWKSTRTCNYCSGFGWPWSIPVHPKGINVVYYDGHAASIGMEEAMSNSVLYTYP